jgi:DNA-binding transcriptional LysR family regulator
MSSSDLNPELLRAFVAVADHLSFTRAALHLNRTQATVSLQVRRLEERIGTTLFRRSTSRVELTVPGNTFLADARRILALAEQAIARISHQKTAGRIRIGVMEDYGTKIMPRLLAGLVEAFPSVQVEMEIGLTARLLKKLGRSFDVVIAMHEDGTPEGELICREQAIWVTAPDHATEERCPLPVALSHSDCLFRIWAIKALNEANRPWRLAYVSPSQAATEAIVSQGLAVTVAKGSTVSSNLRKVPPGKYVPQLPGAEIRLHSARDYDGSAALFVDYLARSLKSAATGS